MVTRRFTPWRPRQTVGSPGPGSVEAPGEPGAWHPTVWYPLAPAGTPGHGLPGCSEAQGYTRGDTHLCAYRGRYAGGVIPGTRKPPSRTGVCAGDIQELRSRPGGAPGSPPLLPGSLSRVGIPEGDPGGVLSPRIPLYQEGPIPLCRGVPIPLHRRRPYPPVSPWTSTTSRATTSGRWGYWVLFKARCCTGSSGLLLL